MGTRIPGARDAGRGASLAAQLERALLLVLPGFAALTLGAAVLVLGRVRPVDSVRAVGGPVEGARVVSFRLEGSTEGPDGSRALAGRDVTVDVQVGAAKVRAFQGALDREGAAQVVAPLPLPAGAPGVSVEVRIGSSQVPAAREVVKTTVAEWASHASRRGGWATRSGDGALTVRAAPSRGVFAVPFAESLVVEVQRQGFGVGGASVQLRAEGADVAAEVAVTDARGHARFTVTPREHVVALFAEVTTADGGKARLDLTPAVIPGALHAVRRGSELLVRSPVARDQAYVAIVNESERLLGATVPLTDDGRGGSVGTLALPPLPDTLLWAVVSSEADLRSPALVGWPLKTGTLSPPATFDVADIPWFDTGPRVLALERQRVLRLRLVLAAIVCVALGLTALLVVRRSRAAGAALSEHLARFGDDAGGSPESSLGLAAALVSLLLAALLALAFVLSQ